MGKFRKKPVVIDAWRWDGDVDALNAWIDSVGFPHRFRPSSGGALRIQTLEGDMTASLGDWIIRGVKGEYYPCKPDIFEATYEAVA